MMDLTKDWCSQSGALHERELVILVLRHVLVVVGDVLRQMICLPCCGGCNTFMEALEKVDALLVHLHQSNQDQTARADTASPVSYGWGGLAHREGAQLL